MSLGGRYVGTPATRQKPTQVIPFTAVACLTESFDGASWPIGADLSWDEGHRGRYTNIGSGTIQGTITDDGSTSTKRTIHAESNALTIQAMDDSELPALKTWRSAEGTARETTELSTSDMTVTATITATSTAVTATWSLIARNEPDAQEDLPTHTQLGYQAFFTDNEISVNVGYISSTSSPGVLLYNFLGLTPSYSHTFAPADEISFSVTGTGSATVVVCSVNGVAEVLTFTDTDLSAMLSAGDSLADLPAGFQAGAGLSALRTGASWDHPTMDDVIGMDDWQVCPA